MTSTTSYVADNMCYIRAQVIHQCYWPDEDQAVKCFCCVRFGNVVEILPHLVTSLEML